MKTTPAPIVRQSLSLVTCMTCGILTVQAQNPAAVQTFYIPIPESQLLEAFQTIKPTSAVSRPLNPVQTYVSVAVLSDDTVIYYDQMENGYDMDPSTPAAAYHPVNNPSGTQIWGDGDLANGKAPGMPGDHLKAGSVIVLNNAVDTSVAPNAGSPLFRAGDKIASSKAISVTRAGWASGTATMLAGANEVFDTFSWGTDFRVPVGQNIPANVGFEMFEYTGAAMMAGEGGASIRIDADANGSFESTINLVEGQSHLINGGLKVGARIVSSSPVQLDLITGDINEIFESRLYRLLPTNLWASSYYTPVSTPASAQGFGGTSTTVWLYNPNSSATEVTYSRRDGNSLTSNVSNKTAGYASKPLGGSAPGNVYGPIVELNSNGTLTGTAPAGAWIGIVNRSSSNSPTIASKVENAREAGASAVIIAANSGGSSYPTETAGTPVIPVVGLTQNGATALRAAGLGAGWVRVSGNQTSSRISIPAGGYAKQVLTDGYGGSFTSTGGKSFYALTTTDSTTYDGSTSGSKTTSPVGNQNWDWGFTLVPQSSLTQQVLIGLGIGRDPTSSAQPNENGNPVWVTTVGNGNVDATVYVDYDADPTTGLLTDPNGYRYDLALAVREYENVKVYSPKGDQSGMLLYTLAPGVKLAAAWGQDVLISSRQEPGLDMGTGIPPLPKFVASKRSVLVNDRDGDGVTSPGDGLRYEIEITNISRVPLSSLNVKDILPQAVNYLAGSTLFTDHSTTVPLADDGSGTAFPLDGTGVLLPTAALPPFKSWMVSYQVEILPFSLIPAGTVAIENSATISSTLLALNEAITVKDVQPLFGKIGDRVWDDFNGNGIQDSGEAGMGGVTVNLYDGDGDLAGTRTTDPNGHYSFTGLLPGNYRVGFVAPGGCVFTTTDADGHGLTAGTNSDADKVTGKTAGFAIRAGESLNSLDAGLIRLGAITGAVLADTTGNGLGDTPLQGVIVALLHEDGSPVTDGHGSPVIGITGADHRYLFSNLLPGNYRVLETDPSGYVSVTENEMPASVPPGGIATVDFTDTQLASLSGYVHVGEQALAGVTLTLLDEFGNPVDGDPETSGVQSLTTVTNGSGYYSFVNVPSGTWQIAQTQPYGYTSFGDVDGGNPDIIGDVKPIVVLPGEHSQDNNFIETLDTCPDDWNEWKFQHPGETAQGNPDADAYDNLAEFAFAMPSNSGSGSPRLGNTAWIIQPSAINADTIEAVFVRPTGASLNVTYTLQYAATLGNPTVWNSLPITPDMVSTENNGDCTETVTLHDLESLAQLGDGKGFVRIRVDLDDDGGNDGEIDHTSFTEVEGWTVTDFALCCSTYNNPYQRESAFTGTISGVNGQVLTFAANDELDTLLAVGGSFYLEVTAGDNQGHRFDIVSSSANTITLANDDSLHAATAPFNTLAGIAPATLAGNRIAVHRHWTLDELFPPASFGATGSQSSADQVQVFADGAWTIHWLYDENDADPATARWVNAADATMADTGTSTIQPGQGLFFNNRKAEATVMAYGEVRENDFIRPHAPGNNLVGGGYPIDQSANGPGGRAMHTGSGFLGTRNFKTADSIFVWKADSIAGAPGFDTYYLLDGASGIAQCRWIKVGDASILARDAETLLLGNRSVFVRSHNGIPQATTLRPWTP